MVSYYPLSDSKSAPHPDELIEFPIKDYSDERFGIDLEESWKILLIKVKEYGYVSEETDELLEWVFPEKYVEDAHTFLHQVGLWHKFMRFYKRHGLPRGYKGYKIRKAEGLIWEKDRTYPSEP